MPTTYIKYLSSAINLRVTVPVDLFILLEAYLIIGSTTSTTCPSPGCCTSPIMSIPDVIVFATFFTSKFTALTADTNGYYYAVDNTHGRVFIYDNKANLISIFGGGKQVNQLEVLVNHADTVLKRILRRADNYLLTVDRNRAVIRIIDAGDHVHQGGFSAAVFAKNR